MFVAELIVALLVAIVLTALFVSVIGWERPDGAGGALLFFFSIVFLFSWAGGLWLAPFGPTVWSVPWLGFLLVGLLVALVLAAAAPPRRDRAALASGPEDDPRVGEASAFNAFFWVLLLVTVLAIVVAYA